MSEKYVPTLDQSSWHPRRRITANLIGSLLNGYGANMPWRKTFDVRLSDNAGLLTLIITFCSPLFALLSAGTFLRAINKIAKKVDPEISRIVISSEQLDFGDASYSPLISWKVNYKDRRHKVFNPRHLREFEDYLWQQVVKHGLLKPANESQEQVYLQVFQNPQVQLDSITRMLEHTDTFGYLNCSVDKAWEEINRYKALNKEDFRFLGNLTRWQAMKICDEMGLLKLRSKKQTPLRPPLENVKFENIVKLVELVGQADEGEVLSTNRSSRSCYLRHLAMSVQRDTMSSSLNMIGSRFGGRDHTTVINALRSIGKYSEEYEVHQNIYHLLCQAADNAGIYNYLKNSS